MSLTPVALTLIVFIGALIAIAGAYGVERSLPDFLRRRTR
jgi:hypothetical protein